ncbi:flagellar protein FliT [Candidatus Pantoea formicae]|uniref:flagellar protein FliT n=1 Tax=Candidatus Pantoea formicae TaxID=2608355 RepID=UPI003ED9CEBE
MCNEVVVQVDQMLERQQQLLSLAEQQAWDAFSEGIEHYRQQMILLMEMDIHPLEETRRREVTARLAHLLTENARLMQHIPVRLAALRSEISALQKTRHSARAYNEISLG